MSEQQAYKEIITMMIDDATDYDLRLILNFIRSYLYNEPTNTA